MFVHSRAGPCGEIHHFIHILLSILVKLMTKWKFVLISARFRVCWCSCCQAVQSKRQKCYF